MATCVLILDTPLRMGSHDLWLPQQNRNQWRWIWDVIWALLHPLPSGWRWAPLGLSSCIISCMLSHFSHIRLFVTPWTVARQAPLSMGFSRQEYWSGLPCPPPGALPNSGIEPVFLSALAGRFFTTSATSIS